MQKRRATLEEVAWLCLAYSLGHSVATRRAVARLRELEGEVQAHLIDPQKSPAPPGFRALGKRR